MRYILESKNSQCGLLRALPHISLFLSDMLEADEIMATYKSARCKRPCHTCMVSQNDLNNMNVMLEDMPSRTHENMQEIIREDRGKEFSVHSVKMLSGNFRNITF